MELLINRNTDPHFNLALEELLADNYPGEIVMLWRNAPAIIVGCNQNTAAEINSDFVREKDIKVVRRITGGGAVYHDLGNINYTISVNDRLLHPEAFAENAEIILRALHKCGIAAEFSGRNDILVDGRKISGSAKSVLKKRTLFHGTLLFDTDLGILTDALNADKEKIRAKGIKSIRSRVANIREFLPQYDTDGFMDKLADILSKENGCIPAEIPADLIDQADKLADKKYRQWQWNYGTPYEYSYIKGGRFSAGTVNISFNIQENKITDFSFSGDFFGKLPAADLAEKLNGLPPRRDMIAERLTSIQIGEYIQGLSAEELLTLFSL